MSKIIFYRDNCIGCSICQEMQPELWRMSKKDGKALLLKSIQKKKISQLEVHNSFLHQTTEVVEACPARVIKIA